jgi:hypothetical protein
MIQSDEDTIHDNEFSESVKVRHFLKSSIIWDTSPCHPLKVSRYLGGTSLTFMIEKISQGSIQHEACRIGLFFDP